MTRELLGDLPQARESMIVDHESVVTVHNDDGPETVRIKFDNITFEGSHTDLHRLIIEADTLLARLTRPPRRRPTTRA